MKKLNPIIAAERDYYIESDNDGPISSYYAEDTFSFKVMQEKLPKEVYKKIVDIIHNNGKLDIDTANVVAHAMKEWALEKGATHYAHWFQPMTGATAEKHDAFVDPVAVGEVVERFSGKQLIQGEPDASSFPSGGIRATFEARGYTIWDISSPAFIRRNGLGTTLCIPTAFISYTGEALDKKTPLLRSMKALSDSAVKLLKILGHSEVKRVTTTLGPEQEYFLIDMDYYFKRQDLVLARRSIVGAPPAKGQELEDQYFGSIKERIQSFMHDMEEELFRLGIPAKTRHNEVAPAQYEIAPVFEEANIATDHNQLVMDTITMVARRHGLAALLHEKPFAAINGSGKHVNWSMADDTGNNLLNPGNTPEDNVQFLVVLVAILKAVHKHSDILRATVASYGNDHRLGANEAPPAIISAFLGDQLSVIVDNIEKGCVTKATDAAIIDLGICSIPAMSKDNTDRNRTSPFAFTGNKFEFRAVGSSQSISLPATVLNTIVAESLDELADKIKAKGGDVRQAAMDVIKEEIKICKPVIFNGDGYTKEWEQEAAKRGLPNYKTTPEALKAFVTDRALKLFEKYNVLSNVELKSRYIIKLEKYIKDMLIEVKSLNNIVTTQIIPAGVKYQSDFASSLESTINALGKDADVAEQKEVLKNISALISKISKLTKEIVATADKASEIHDEQKKAEILCKDVKTKMDAVRVFIDELEAQVDDDIWPMPKYWEMLFIF